MLCLAISSGVNGIAEVLLRLHARRERQVAHVLDARADHRVVHPRGDQRGGEVDRLLGGAALAVDRRAGRLDRQALLQPRVARDVEALLAELLDAAGDHVLDLGRLDARALDHLACSTCRAARSGGCPCSSPSPCARGRSACAPPRRSRPHVPLLASSGNPPRSVAGYGEEAYASGRDWSAFWKMRQPHPQ